MARRELPKDAQALLERLQPAALEGHLARFARTRGPDLLARTVGLQAWVESRRASGVWQRGRELAGPIGPEVDVLDADGRQFRGINLAAQDYLGLTADEAVRSAAAETLAELGPHAASTPAGLGRHRECRALERALAEHLGCDRATLFPTGWMACFGVVAALVRQGDFVILDELASNPLRQGAATATSNVVRFPHNDFGGLRRVLRGVRATNKLSGILVVVESLYPLESDAPDLGAIRETCSEFGAALVVDISHDLGLLGPQGTGQLGAQQALGEPDVVVGSLSDCLASSGGFALTRSPAVERFIEHYGIAHTFSTALSPVQAAVARASLDVVRSPRGDALRARLAENVNTLREALDAADVETIGEPFGVVPVRIGDELQLRITAALVEGRGVLTESFEFPLVKIGQARLCLHAMASHTQEQLERAASVISESIADARAIVSRLEV